jgi:hypothetical protein
VGSPWATADGLHSAQPTLIEAISADRVTRHAEEAPIVTKSYHDLPSPLFVTAAARTFACSVTARGAA